MGTINTINSRKIFLATLGIITFLLTINLMIIYLRFFEGYEYLKGFWNGFYFDSEANYPSLYSFLAILFCAIMLWIIGNLKVERRQKKTVSWRLLSLVFVFLAIDEFASIHEHLIVPAQSLFNISSGRSKYLYFAWVIPYSLLSLVIGLILIRFLIKLDKPTRTLFIFAGLVFLSGAIGMEMVGGKYWAQQGWAVDGTDGIDLRYALIVTIEEFLEMVGIAIFLYALCHYYLKAKKTIVLSVKLSDIENASDFEKKSLPNDN